MLAALLRGVEAFELTEDEEAAGVLLAETFSFWRQYTTQGKIK